MKTVQNIFVSLLPIFLIAFLVGGCGKKEASTDSKSTDSKTTTGTTSPGSNDADGLITQYESLMNEYVAVVKSVKGGDYNQTAKMQDLANRTQVWSKKLADMAPTLSAAQTDRIAKISQMAADAMK